MTTQEEILFTARWGGGGCAFKHTSDLKTKCLENRIHNQGKGVEEEEVVVFS